MRLLGCSGAFLLRLAEYFTQSDSAVRSQLGGLQEICLSIKRNSEVGEREDLAPKSCLVLDRSAEG